MQKLKAEVQIIGINPYVLLPDEVLTELFKQAGKDKGPIQVRGTINDKPYTQTLVKYDGIWRLYINLKMLKNSPRRIGEVINVTIEFDPEQRVITPHPKLIRALDENHEAKRVFDGLRPSLQLEIVRYISRLKSEESVDRNVVRAIDFLLGRGRFVGRDKPY
ncbi:YdeI/OmpD-associated family protein [Telluribacter sp. SYSU D00476]|uniref:YdeI/OmpD-associated family protein n=1 Tax=Telluribacter sp. SYSU D00476 TaxID=2811430 RepID=UPI001FF6A72C|nr:DUF1905 domain-containing protein [Telluribacter sp. SYSU D00476]